MLRPHWRELALCLALVATLQLSGFNVLIYYSVIIFDMAGIPWVDPNLAAVASLICLLLSFVVVVFFTFRYYQYFDIVTFDPKMIKPTF